MPLGTRVPDHQGTEPMTQLLDHQRSQGRQPQARRLGAQGIVLDVDAQIVFRDGEILPRLPSKEYQLLKFLLENAGRVVSREQIMERVWGAVLSSTGASTVDVHMRRLRHRVESDPTRPFRIRTIRGEGYIFDLSPVPAPE